MKKATILGSLPTLLLLLLSVPVLATSGCCSSHGGVNCAAGAQGNGNVICNDGWRGSSCSYSSMVMCGGSTTHNNPTSTPTPKPKIVIPTPTPRPVAPTATPQPQPTPTVTPIPTATPGPTSTPTPTQIPPTPTIEPSPSGKGSIGTAEVLGAKVSKKPVKNPSLSDWGISLGVLGVMGYVGWRLVKGVIKGVRKLFVKKNPVE